MKNLINKKVLAALGTLKTPKNYAKNLQGKNKKPVSRQYIYKLIKEGKINYLNIDGVPFIIDQPGEPGTGNNNQ
jgi:hypothetical protein